MIVVKEDIMDRTDYAGIGRRLLACISSKMTAEEQEKLKDDSVFIEAKITSYPSSEIGNKIFMLEKKLLGKYVTAFLKLGRIEVDANDFSSLWWKTFLVEYLDMCADKMRTESFSVWFPFSGVSTVSELDIKLSVEGF